MKLREFLIIVYTIRTLKLFTFNIDMKKQNYTFTKDYLDCIAQAWLFTFKHDEQQIQADDVFLWVWKYTIKKWFSDVFWNLLWIQWWSKIVKDFIETHYEEWNQPKLGKHTFHLDPIFQEYFKVYSDKWIEKLHFLILFIASLDNLSVDISDYLENNNIDLAKIRERVEKIIDTIDQIEMSPTDFFTMVSNMVSSLWLSIDQMDMFFDVNQMDVMETMMSDWDTDLIDGPWWDTDSTIKTTPKDDEEKKLTIEYFATDLTDEAKNGFLDPVIWRDKEIQQIIYTLMRKTKNNPLLLWEAWVWKTAIVEGLAQKILAGDVPAKLKNKRLMMIDIWSLVAGTKYRWEFESRLKAIIEEAMDPTNNIIMFVDEVHTLIGAGNAEWSADAANMLKPLLSRGKIQMVWATTFDEYQKHIEKDPALKRRFQEISVDEPSQEEALEILTGIRSKFEEYHGVSIDADALQYAVNYSTRYIMNKHLPDKAIDLIDEAAARVSTLNQKLKTDDAYVSIQKKISKIKWEIETSIEKQDYFKAAELKDKEEEMKKKMKTMRSQHNLPKHLRPAVTMMDVGKVLSDKLWLPLEQVTESEVEQLSHLDAHLKSLILAQDEAVDAVVRAIRRNRLSPIESTKPIASFLFLWPSWVGKTYLAKLLAQEYFWDPKSLIRVDMSEFMERHSASKLIGSAPGYVWYEEGWILTEQVRRKPYSVILFDEIEKASPDILNVMLQILDEWHLKDNKWRWIDFKNTIIIMTSNIWAEEFWHKQVSIWFSDETGEEKVSKEMSDGDFDTVKLRILEQVKNYMAPELINRLSQMVVFKPLSKDVLQNIFKIEIKTFLDTWKQKKWIKLPSFNKKKVSWIVDTLYNPQLWARPIQRFIHDEIEPELIDQVMQQWVKK